MRFDGESQERHISHLSGVEKNLGGLSIQRILDKKVFNKKYLEGINESMQGHFFSIQGDRYMRY